MNTAIADIEEIQAIAQKEYRLVKVDGDIGKITTGAVRALVDTTHIKDIQSILQRRFSIKVDGMVGDHTMRALAELDELGDIESASTAPQAKSERLQASFFAGPQDVRGFRRCKGMGGSDVYCFGKGDNGIGKWGQDTTLTTRNSAALPREVWRRAGKSGGARLWVEHKGKRVEGFLDDTMPALENIENGADIDLNPGYAVAFGVDPEQMNNRMLNDVKWGWL